MHCPNLDDAKMSVMMDETSTWGPSFSFGGHKLVNQATQLLGGGKKKKSGAHAVANSDPLLGALTELLEKFETKRLQHPKRNAKPSWRDALAKVLDRPTSGRGLLNKLKSLVRAEEGAPGLRRCQTNQVQKDESMRMFLPTRGSRQ